MEESNTVVNEDVTDPIVDPVLDPLEDPTNLPPADSIVNEDPIDPANPLAPGDKTPPNLLLKSKQEEAEKRRIAEAERDQQAEENQRLREENELLRSSTLSEEDVQSDEGKALARRIAQLEQDKAKDQVITAYPVLKEKWAEFEEFQSKPENKGMSSKTAAKAYLIEQGYFDKRRDGNETSTGGSRNPASTSMSVDDVANLRKNNPRKYADMIAKGQIKL